MKKIFALLLVVALLCAACGTTPADPTVPTAPETTPEDTATRPQVTVDYPANYISLSVSYEDGTYAALTAYDDGMGGAYVEYQGDVRKVATMDQGILFAITTELADCGLASLNGDNLIGDGLDSASMYVSFPDETYWGAGYTGFISEEFLEGYEKMDAYFQTLLADVPEYVPQPQVIGEVNPDALAAITAVLERIESAALDMFCIMDVPAEEAFTAGLSSADGITSITSCSPVMMATAYSFVIVTVEDESTIEAVREDLKSNMDWNKWVCVSAENAVMAQKGNMVLFIMGSGDLFTQSDGNVRGNGWTDIVYFVNSNM